MKTVLLPTRPFGSGGMVLPAISVGTAAIGRPAYLTLDHGRDVTDASVDGMRRRTFEILDTAYAAGVRHIDTAHSYGLAECFIAEWMDSAKPEGVFVTSKWGYSYVGDWRLDVAPQEVKDLRLATYARQAVLSFRRFGLRLGGFQIHSATIESGVLSDPAVLDVMRSLAEAGVRIGISTSGPRQADAIDLMIELTERNQIPFSFVEVTWNLLETSAGAAMARASSAGMGVIVKEALANGILARGTQVPSRVLAAAERHSVGPDAICLAAALALDSEPVVLAGPTTVDHLRQNLKAVSLEVSTDELLELSSEPRDPGAYWAARSKLPWT